MINGSIRIMVGLAAALLVGTLAQAADKPMGADKPAAADTGKGGAASDTADVLGKLHQSNQKEIQMGKLAEKQGQSKEAKQFGKMLVKDHGAADKKVMALAKQEKIDLPTEATATKDMESLPPGAGFDAAFGKAMVEDHQKDIAEVKKAIDATSDDKLKKLLTEMLPTLEKHEQTAQKLASGHSQAMK